MKSRREILHPLAVILLFLFFSSLYSLSVLNLIAFLELIGKIS